MLTGKGEEGTTCSSNILDINQVFWPRCDLLFLIPIFCFTAQLLPKSVCTERVCRDSQQKFPMGGFLHKQVIYFLKCDVFSKQ